VFFGLSIKVLIHLKKKKSFTWIRFPLPILFTYGPGCQILRHWWALSSLMPMLASSGQLPFHPSRYFWYI
jgi:hypothetical protein